jgi:hypothetical protein
MAIGLQSMKQVMLVLLVMGLVSVPHFCAAADNSRGDLPKAATESDLYFKVVLAQPVNMAKLKPGDVVDGTLSRDVYSSDHKLFSAGSNVRLTVDHLESRRRVPNDHWPWAIKLFIPRHEKYPAFKTATIRQAQGESSLHVSLISAVRMREIHAKAKDHKGKSGQGSADERGAVEVSKSSSKKPATPTLVLEATAIENSPSTVANGSEAASADPTSSTAETLPVGTQCKILLLGSVSASKSKRGDVVRARLLEPVVLNSRVVLPAGSLFEGKVVKETPPRWLSRSGSLYLTFNEVALPDGNHLPIAASIAGVELDQRSHTRIDSEGKLRGEGLGKAWMAANLGVTVGLGKVADDGLQLVIEAIVSTATDVSTAGTGRIVASCVSGLFMITRHGRDVVLPRFTEVNISLDRPVSLRSAAPIEGSGVVAGGK